MDREIAHALARGDERAFATIFDVLGDDLRRHAFKFVQSMDVAEDVVQDVLCKLWIQHDQWELRDSLRGYLYGAVRNRALDELAHRTVRETTTETVRDSLYDTVMHIDRWSEAGDEYRDSRIRSTIHRVLETLHPRIQATVLLRIDYGFRYAHIARMLNMSVDTVRLHLIKFRSVFRTALAE
jgi:RNA polymerase sigma-70 factor (ECF subfamily)